MAFRFFFGGLFAYFTVSLAFFAWNNHCVEYCAVQSALVQKDAPEKRIVFQFPT